MKKILISAFTVVMILTTANAALADYGKQTKTSGCQIINGFQDASCTPGAVLTTDSKEVCVSGYSKSVRNVSLKTKKAVFAEYDISYNKHSNYEVDHLISLELGGSNDISNLWPELSKGDNGALIKDKFENYLHSQVCSGKLSLADAQSEISGDWVKYWVATGKSSVSKKAITKPATTKKATTKKTTPVVKVEPSTNNEIPSTSPQPVPIEIVTPAPVIQQSQPTTTTNGATGICNDGTYTYAVHHQGACSHHG
jgi:hypothetical protein